MAYTAAGYPYLEIDGVPLWIDGAWKLMDVEKLFGGPAVRGTSTLVPHAAGRKANKLHADETECALTMQIYGDAIGNGGATTGTNFSRLVANITDLRTNVYAQPSGATRTAVLHESAGVTYTAGIQVIAPMGLVFVSDHQQNATLDLRVPVWFA